MGKCIGCGNPTGTHPITGSVPYCSLDCRIKCEAGTNPLYNWLRSVIP